MPISNPGAGASLTVADTEVYNAVSPTFPLVDLDISAVVGANVALVLLKVVATAVTWYFQKNGVAGEMSISGSGVRRFCVVVTDANGIFEHGASSAAALVITVQGYIK